MLVSCNDSIFLFSVSAYCFAVPKSLYRVLVIYPFSRSMRCFHLRCFTLVRLLIACAPCADNPLSFRHCAVFTPCEGIPFSTIKSKSPCGFDCAVLFVWLLLFRRMTNNGPIAVIGDSVLQTWFSMPLATCAAIKFSKIKSFGFPLRREYYRKCWNWIPKTGKTCEWVGVGVSLCRSKIPTPRESGFSSTAPMRLTRTGRGFLAR